MKWRLEFSTEWGEGDGGRKQQYIPMHWDLATQNAKKKICPTNLGNLSSKTF
jgi:hypothetical protein